MHSNKNRNSITEWLIPAALIALSLVPVLAGTARLCELTSDAEITKDNARFFASPLPVIAHIISVSLYAILGAFQFAKSFRLRHTRWHRMIGKWLLVPAGLAAALSGLWMTLFYPWPAGDGVILYGERLLFGSAMLISVSLGVVALWRRDYTSHGEWMMRGYAIGLGAGTQVLTHLPWMLLFGTPQEFTRAMLMGAGWIINIAVVEWIIHRRQSHRTQAALSYAR